MRSSTLLHLNVRDAAAAAVAPLKISGLGVPQTPPESLSPNLQPPSPPLPTTALPVPVPCCLGPYLLTGPLPGSSLISCVHLPTEEHLVCKVVGRREAELAARLGPHGANPVLEALSGPNWIALVHRPGHGDLHSYVRCCRRLPEPEAARLFRQLAAVVSAAHQQNVVLRDLKLRKFVFADPNRTELKLETLDDAILLPDGDDRLSDRHGCPAYVSPELLEDGCYSGKAADCWSLGIMLYVMLVGRYPFHDADPPTVLARVKSGRFSIPDCLSPPARCLIRSLLRRNPEERLRADEVLDHPWLRYPISCVPRRCPLDQVVGRREAELAARLGPHGANPVLEALSGPNWIALVHRPGHGDLHSYVRCCRRLPEPEAARLFRQLAAVVSAAHQQNVVLRDLKLRKFVFADPNRTELKLETLDDAILLPDGDDRLSDRHGCPAYVSPELLEDGCYSGKAADCWSLGIMLYVMLVGRYPFHDADPPTVLARVKSGRFSIPDCLSPPARCLIRSLLRRNPEERLRADEVLDHPWLRYPISCVPRRCPLDQVVPS
ncbi:TRIB2 [Cordylochernes scorpioides]|uniref:TRIB2 n=1 Tax=Cordylochernes scorpioides TaxID=51811 RepID=A0ABY6L0X3_9ARAC|nr:TRIB2 [Cordylochernes scorpioides]